MEKIGKMLFYLNITDLWDSPLVCRLNGSSTLLRQCRQDACLTSSNNTKDRQDAHPTILLISCGVGVPPASIPEI